jgi:hypothetical protein
VTLNHWVAGSIPARCTKASRANDFGLNGGAQISDNSVRSRCEKINLSGSWGSL